MEVSPSRSIEKMLIFPTYEHSHTLPIEQPANIFFNRVFTKENATSFLRKSSSPFFLQELRPLTPLKETDRFTSLMLIGMKKIMCNNHSYIYENEEPWKAIPKNEISCDVIQNEPLKPDEIISIENNKILEGLTLLKSSFSLSVGGNKDKQEEEELQLKVVEAISMKNRTHGYSTNV
jgi:hypothetical protein